MPRDHSWPPAAVAIGLLMQLLPFLIHGRTDGPDVSALNVMYSNLGSPSKLTAWTSNGGDPCGQHWKGIKCSGSSVTEIRLSSLGLTGSMGYQLSSLTSVTYFDLSKNNLQGDIPYQLPPNAIHINLAGNSFTGGVPYSISQMSDLKYLNLGENQLSGQLADMFGKLPSLSLLDLSFNQLKGNLPQSLGSLSSIRTLHLQNNQFTGPIDVLATLPLEDLNVQNNQFTGWVPNELKNINNLQTQGNSWSSGPAPARHTPPGGKVTGDGGDNSSGGKKSSKGGNRTKSGVNGGAIAGIVIAVLILGVVLFVIVSKRRSSPHYIDEENLSQTRPFTPLASHEFKELKPMEASSDMNIPHTSPSMGLTPPPSDWHKSFSDNEFVSKLSSKKSMDPINATVYPLVDLQPATRNFSPSCVLGEGSIGKVYKAKYADGKVLAVKKINSAYLQNSNSEDFNHLVSGISQLHHPNITELIGYCSESGHHLLVYEFHRNGSLHNFLHLSDEYSRPLTWDTRIRIALGIARAVEYLHETCSPSAVHKNIKSANVLLDEDLNPHLTDCGLAILYQDTNQNLGPGYNAPECTNHSTYTLKSDVYSFGVVMLELLTGRTPYDSSKPRSEQPLVQWATPQLHDIDALSRMVDPALRGLYRPKSLSRFADVIALCVQPEPEFRPPISEVVQDLVRCVQRPSLDKRGGDLAASCRSDDSDCHYY